MRWYLNQWAEYSRTEDRKYQNLSLLLVFLVSEREDVLVGFFSSFFSPLTYSLELCCGPDLCLTCLCFACRSFKLPGLDSTPGCSLDSILLSHYFSRYGGIAYTLQPRTLEREHLSEEIFHGNQHCSLNWSVWLSLLVFLRHSLASRNPLHEEATTARLDCSFCAYEELLALFSSQYWVLTLFL